jgi:hypothetical protein
MAAMNLMQNFRNKNEQDLVSNLIEEAIEQRGFDVHYIVRDMLNTDYILGESSMSEFTEFYLMPAYLESMEHFNGNGDLFDAFGLSMTDAATFQIGVRKFRTVVEEKANLPRPREGDLIYLPFADSLWEITKVKLDDKFYQTGINHSYRLVSKLFSYSHEDIETNTETNFNKLGTKTPQSDDGLRNLLGLSVTDLHDESVVLEKETKTTTADNFNPADPFSY